MRAGENGRIAIRWDQTEIDGLEAAPLSFLVVGAAWSWRGQARLLVDAADQGQQRAGGAQAHPARTLGSYAPLPDVTAAASGVLVLTNGAQNYTATLISATGESTPTLVFENECPARDQEFWISEITEVERQNGEATPTDDTVIAFPARLQADDRLVVPDLRSVAIAGRRVD